MDSAFNWAAILAQMSAYVNGFLSTGHYFEISVSLS